MERKPKVKKSSSFPSFSFPILPPSVLFLYNEFQVLLLSLVLISDLFHFICFNAYRERRGKYKKEMGIGRKINYRKGEEKKFGMSSSLLSLQSQFQMLSDS